MFSSRPLGGQPKSPGTEKFLKQKSCESYGPDLISEINKDGQYSWTQVDENDIAQFVVVNEPALPNWMGSCHPNGSLYEKPLDLRAAQAEHQRFREELERNGCVVKTVREILAQDCDENVVARVQLEDLAKKCLRYKLLIDEDEEDEEGDSQSTSNHIDQSHSSNGSNQSFQGQKTRRQSFHGDGQHRPMQLTAREEYLISDDYKKECVEKMDVEQLVEVILTNPTIHLKKSDKDTELLVVNYTYEPLVNLVFCRDQQITTAKGVVMGRPRSPIRQREVEVMKFCFEKLGVPIVGRIESPGTLEGGDFFPAGSDLAMVGIGLRSNMDAVEYLLSNDLFGTRRVAVVKDYFDQHQQRMHLDTVFNIIGPKVCLMLDIIQGENSPLRRLVDEYVYDPKEQRYFLERHDIEFYNYLKQEGYSIINVSESMQEAYGCNGLNLGNNTMVTVDRITAKHIARSGSFNGRIIVVDFTNNTNMFGSVHCCSQVISRRAGNTQSTPSKASISFAQAVSDETYSQLHKFCATGNIEKVKDILKRHPKIEMNWQDYQGRSALHAACLSSNPSLVTLLLDTFNANPNILDSWHLAPLDYANKKNDSASQEIAKILVARGSKLAKDIETASKSDSSSSPSVQSSENQLSVVVPNQAQQQSHVSILSRFRPYVVAGPMHQSNPHTARKFLMIAPDNFDVNWYTSVDNVLMSEAHNEFRRLTQVERSGRRGVYAAMLKEFAELHRVLTVDLGVETFLSTHELFHHTPDALFVADWFSTHPCSETGLDKPTLVLYSMKAPTRRGEKRTDLVNFLRTGYPKVIDFTPCESGSLDVIETESASHSLEDLRSSQVRAKSTCRPLEFSSMVLDRESKIAYAASPCQRIDPEALALWSGKLGYKVVTFRLNLDLKHPLLTQLQHTRVLLCVGAKFNMVCTEAIHPDEREKILSTLSQGGKKINIEFTVEQAAKFAVTGSLELLDRESNLVLLISASAFMTFTPSQIRQIEGTGARIMTVNLSTIEKLGGGSTSGVVAGLY